MTKARRKGYAYLLKDADVKRWYDNVARGSSVTADVYLRRVGSFCLHFKRAPKNLVSLSDSELYKMLLDYVSSMEKDGKAGSYIESALKAVKSWLSHNGKEVRRKIKIRGARPCHLFGSFATGDINEGSNIDILVVADLKEDLMDRIWTLMDMNTFNILIEPVRYTPKEFTQIKNRKNPFITEVFEKDKIVYKS